MGLGALPERCRLNILCTGGGARGALEDAREASVDVELILELLAPRR